MPNHIGLEVEKRHPWDLKSRGLWWKMGNVGRNSGVEGTAMLLMGKYKKELLLVLTFALIMRATISIVTVVVNKSNCAFYTSDTGSYVAPAKSLIESRSFDLGGKPYLFRTPGYPLLLIPGILVGKMVFITIGLQILISCVTVAIVFELALELFNSRKIAIIAALLYASEPMSIVFSSFLMSETLFTFCIASFVLCLVKYQQMGSTRYIIMAAVALSAGVYVRPVAYFLPVYTCLILLFVMLFNRVKLTRSVIDVLIFFAISATLIGAWQIRNYNKTSWGGFSSSGIVMFYNSNYLPAIRLLSAGKISDYDSAFLIQTDWPDNELNGPDTQQVKELSRNYEYMRDEVLKVIRDNPSAVVSFYLKRMVKYFLAPGAIQMLNLFNVKVPKRVVEEKRGKSLLEKRRLYYENAPIYFWADAMFGVWLGLCLMFVLVAVVSKEVWHRVPVGLLFVIGYFAVVSASTPTASRIRHPIMPLLCVLAAFGACRIIKTINETLHSRKENPAKHVPS